jgi:hypothetical protein
MLAKFKQWYAKPYDDNMSATSWFLFFGLVMVISTMWVLVIREIKSVAE